MKKTFLPTRRSKTKGLQCIIILVIIYLLDIAIPVYGLDTITFNYGIKPFLWCCTIYLNYRCPRLSPRSKQRNRNRIKWSAFYFAVVYVLFQVMLGLFLSFGLSPYDHSYKGILTNIIFVGTRLIGLEMIRNTIVQTFTKKEKITTFIIIACFITITTLSFHHYTRLNNMKSLVTYCAELFLPCFSENLFLTYVVYLGGPVPAILYKSIMEGFHWFSPILPNLNWLTKALFGILLPLFYFLILLNMRLTATRRTRKTNKEKESLLGWLFISFISILAIWFVMGVFPIYPSVVVSGSMKPMIQPGDIILVKKVTSLEEIRKEDVIQFELDGILISHRIIKINNTYEGVSYETKGDNNSVADSRLVHPEQLKGKIVKVVPKLGLPTLLIKNKDPNQAVEF